MRRPIVFLADNLSYAFSVLAAGWAAAFTVWEVGHPNLLENLLLSNELTAALREQLLLRVVAGSVLAFVLWAILGLALVAAKRPAGFTMQRAAALALSVTLLPFLPILALPILGTERPFLVFFFVAAMAAISFVTVNRAARLFGPAPAWTNWPAAARAGLIAACGLALGYAVFMSALTVARHNSFLTHSFDLGIHDQIIYNALHRGVLRSTQHGPEPINYLGNHFAPILYLVAPLYLLKPDARTLLVLQSLMLALGAVPIYLLAREKLHSTALAIAFSASYLLFPALHGINTFDFHQIALVTALLLWALYFLETGRTKLFLLFLLGAAATKEEVALTVAAFGLYLCLVKRRYRLGALLAVGGVAYFVVVVGYVMPALGGTPQVYRFGGLMAGGSGGLPAVVTTLLTNPAYVLIYIFGDPRKLEFLCLLLLPVLFLPLLAGRSLVLAIPAFSVALLASTEENFSIGTQYPAVMVPFVAFLAIVGARRLEPRRFGRLALAAAILTASLAMNYEYGWLFGRMFQGIPSPTPHDRVVDTFFSQIPQGASVSTLSDLVPHLSDRESVYVFPAIQHADYVLFDAQPAANFWPFTSRNARFEAVLALAPSLLSGEYGVARTDDGVLLLERGDDQSQNPGMLRLLLSTKVEAESLPSDFTGPSEQDNAASGGQARVADWALPHLEARSAAVYGPYASLLPGKYRVSFRLKLEPGSARHGKVATVDIFSTTMGGALAGQNIAVQDFASPGRYQDFSVEVEIPKTLDDLEYRVLYAGPERLWVDVVEITPLQAAIPAASFEAEDLPGDSEVVADAGASNGVARVFSVSQEDGDGSQTLVAGPGSTALIPGHYRANYTLKLDPGAPDGPVATLDVYSKTAGGSLATREIEAGDFKTPGKYEALSLDFETKQAWPDVEFRVFPRGHGTLWADRIGVDYLLQ
jgi:uncharacterized membrane protein